MNPHNNGHDTLLTLDQLEELDVTQLEHIARQEGVNLASMGVQRGLARAEESAAVRPVSDGLQQWYARISRGALIVGSVTLLTIMSTLERVLMPLSIVLFLIADIVRMRSGLLFGDSALASPLAVVTVLVYLGLIVAEITETNGQGSVIPSLHGFFSLWEYKLGLSTNRTPRRTALEDRLISTRKRVGRVILAFGTLGQIRPALAPFLSVPVRDIPLTLYQIGTLELLLTAGFGFMMTMALLDGLYFVVRYNYRQYATLSREVTDFLARSYASSEAIDQARQEYLISVILKHRNKQS